MDSSASSSHNPLIAFFNGVGTDHRGRVISTILCMSTDELERSHDYIQTLFPLPERSPFAWNVPIVDREVFYAFSERTELRTNLQNAFRVMLKFYGFDLTTDLAGNIHIEDGPSLAGNPKVWNRRSDHNHLRITRIIRSLRVLGLEAEGMAFYDKLISCSTGSSPRSREFWRRAAFRNLNIRPDQEGVEDDDLTIGPRFLREFEETRLEISMEPREKIKIDYAPASERPAEKRRKQAQTSLEHS